MYLLDAISQTRDKKSYPHIILTFIWLSLFNFPTMCVPILHILFLTIMTLWYALFEPRKRY